MVRALLLPAAGLLRYPGPLQDLLGLATFAAIAVHLLRIRRVGPPALRLGT
jgi:hypothetical protein